MLRVATYNVRGLKDDRRALVRVIRALRPDVLCLQEAPRLPGWRRERRALARAAGLSVAAGGRVGGTAVLISPAVRLLRGRGHRLRWFPGLEWRSVALAVVEKTAEKDRERYAVCSAHLDLQAGARLSHAAQIMPILEREARQSGAAPVLAGDLNEVPGSPVWRLLESRYTDCFTAARDAAPRIAAGIAAGIGAGIGAGGDDDRAGATFPARDPRARIDAIFAGPCLTVVSYGGADVRAEDLPVASDHLPVVAEIAVTPSAGA
ncbi:endonuclease/exonuclease/phosphatase family protein [Microbispora hainanensis]|uniref:Endonuclease/exonuclease/phosphatase n=1 Tax=Microbispora hainanensis TaxID=568844 RepID=A0A544Z3G1_9ACTN|nr:endonuclease/exonuclease/phosphatase family protein [Microbispora hainanensis]TQS23568.1 endonuclease/exonuclease/phosphatase [Microbispora hainanensis]